MHRYLKKFDHGVHARFDNALRHGLPVSRVRNHLGIVRRVKVPAPGPNPRPLLDVFEYGPLHVAHHLSPGLPLNDALGNIPVDGGLRRLGLLGFPQDAAG
jgi:hypothetical protein